MKICNVLNCNNEHHAKDYCLKHYTRFMRYGNPLTIKRIRNNNHPKYCSINNCNELHEARGLCHKHYIGKWNKQHPEYILKQHIIYLQKLGKQFNMNDMEYSYAVQSWSKVVRKRDKICQVCGRKENLNAHHVLFKQYFPELSLNINNGITLCVPCHEELHGFKVYPKNLFT